ncbi:hypothetical protein IE81DRAFT_368136 [Ceraceosorus guamensis]|uniref:Uncharacterized protein n=1 Tax=Ceraceosorus guamensis TaxID=1522189 RepID=A0A316VUR9_9BASI|nr:hypothetical protein IE81DRAFT_368136 [Ceraceosorus guamensis]PWN40648.1 hypothetical protein IE81DRAFT_368136 [Ceraceosorus guamensis]
MMHPSAPLRVSGNRQSSVAESAAEGQPSGAGPPRFRAPRYSLGSSGSLSRTAPRDTNQVSGPSTRAPHERASLASSRRTRLDSPDASRSFRASSGRASLSSTRSTYEDFDAPAFCREYSSYIAAALADRGNHVGESQSGRASASKRLRTSFRSPRASASIAQPPEEDLPDDLAYILQSGGSIVDKGKARAWNESHLNEEDEATRKQKNASFLARINASVEQKLAVSQTKIPNEELADAQQQADLLTDNVAAQPADAEQQQQTETVSEASQALRRDEATQTTSAVFEGPAELSAKREQTPNGRVDLAGRAIEELLSRGGLASPSNEARQPFGGLETISQESVGKDGPSSLFQSGLDIEAVLRQRAQMEEAQQSEAEEEGMYRESAEISPEAGPSRRLIQEIEADQPSVEDVLYGNAGIPEEDHGDAPIEQDSDSDSDSEGGDESEDVIDTDGQAEAISDSGIKVQYTNVQGLTDEAPEYDSDEVVSEDTGQQEDGAEDGEEEDGEREPSEEESEEDYNGFGADPSGRSRLYANPASQKTGHLPTRSPSGQPEVISLLSDSDEDENRAGTSREGGDSSEEDELSERGAEAEEDFPASHPTSATEALQEDISMEEPRFDLNDQSGSRHDDQSLANDYHATTYLPPNLSAEVPGWQGAAESAGVASAIESVWQPAESHAQVGVDDDGVGRQVDGIRFSLAEAPGSSHHAHIDPGLFADWMHSSAPHASIALPVTTDPFTPHASLPLPEETTLSSNLPIALAETHLANATMPEAATVTLGNTPTSSGASDQRVEEVTAPSFEAEPGGAQSLAEQTILPTTLDEAPTSRSAPLSAQPSLHHENNLHPEGADVLQQPGVEEATEEQTLRRSPSNPPGNPDRLLSSHDTSSEQDDVFASATSAANATEVQSGEELLALKHSIQSTSSANLNPDQQVRPPPSLASTAGSAIREAIGAVAVASSSAASEHLPLPAPGGGGLIEFKKRFGSTLPATSEVASAGGGRSEPPTPGVVAPQSAFPPPDSHILRPLSPAPPISTDQVLVADSAELLRVKEKAAEQVVSQIHSAPASTHGGSVAGTSHRESDPKSDFNYSAEVSQNAAIQHIETAADLVDMKAHVALTEPPRAPGSLKTNLSDVAASHADHEPAEAELDGLAEDVSESRAADTVTATFHSSDTLTTLASEAPPLTTQNDHVSVAPAVKPPVAAPTSSSALTSEPTFLDPPLRKSSGSSDASSWLARGQHRHFHPHGQTAPRIMQSGSSVTSGAPKQPANDSQTTPEDENNEGHKTKSAADDGENGEFVPQYERPVTRSQCHFSLISFPSMTSPDGFCTFVAPHCSVRRDRLEQEGAKERGAASEAQNNDKEWFNSVDLPEELYHSLCRVCDPDLLEFTAVLPDTRPIELRTFHEKSEASSEPREHNHGRSKAATSPSSAAAMELPEEEKLDATGEPDAAALLKQRDAAIHASQPQISSTPVLDHPPAVEEIRGVSTSPRRARISPEVRSPLRRSERAPKARKQFDDDASPPSASLTTRLNERIIQTRRPFRATSSSMVDLESDSEDAATASPVASRDSESGVTTSPSATRSAPRSHAKRSARRSDKGGPLADFVPTSNASSDSEEQGRRGGRKRAKATDNAPAHEDHLDHVAAAIEEDNMWHASADLQSPEQAPADDKTDADLPKSAELITPAPVSKRTYSRAGSARATKGGRRSVGTNADGGRYVEKVNLAGPPSSEEEDVRERTEAENKKRARAQGRRSAKKAEAAQEREEAREAVKELNTLDPASPNESRKRRRASKDPSWNPRKADDAESEEAAEEGGDADSVVSGPTTPAPRRGSKRAKSGSVGAEESSKARIERKQSPAPARRKSSRLSFANPTPSK